MEHLVEGIGWSDITPAPGTPQGGWGAQPKQRKSLDGSTPSRRHDRRTLGWLERTMRAFSHGVRPW